MKNLIQIKKFQLSVRYNVFGFVLQKLGMYVKSPMGAWHTVEVIEPSVIFEAKDGAYIPLTIEDVWSYE